MVTEVQILGERCSGTNFLEKLLEMNFHVKCVWSSGWKHWPLVDTMKPHVVYIYIHRNIHDWIGSNLKNRHHVPSGVKDILRERWLIDAPHVPGNIPRTLIEQRERFLESIFAMQSGIHYWVDYDWLCEHQVAWLEKLNLPRKGGLAGYTLKVDPGGRVTRKEWVRSASYPITSILHKSEYEQWARTMITRNLAELGLPESAESLVGSAPDSAR